MAFDPPIPPPKSIDLKKPIKGRHNYLLEDVERAVNTSIAASLKSNGGLLDFYQEIRLSSVNNKN